MIIIFFWYFFQCSFWRSSLIAFSPIIELCGYLRSQVEEKFGDQWRVCIAGFVFLRYLTPVIVSPDGFKVLPAGVTRNRNSGRVLMIIGKVMQNLANGVLFGAKEEFMQVFNPTLEKFMPALEEHYEVLSNGQFLKDKTNEKLTYERPLTDRTVIAKVVAEHCKKCFQKMALQLEPEDIEALMEIAFPNIELHVYFSNFPEYHGKPMSVVVSTSSTIADMVANICRVAKLREDPDNVRVRT
eukprot:TRINITY_DN1079_c0_g1_i2.p1 TRINITY_DN1079_c0_g1~~TRINITY_DN1079_c0_g1_i2.p1  ORF type:complete len:241 (+),score=64.49 TRINITY_DN1079_c0_g1_i2:164-886(+)